MNQVILNKHLEAVENIKKIETSPFFYTRLKAKMEQENETLFLNWNIKTTWAIASLAMLVCINSYMLFNQKNEKENTAFAKPTIENFATAYNLNITSY
jgi:hypothetical protein